ncbi:MAG: minor capsid protein [Oscillospiraceae bacterium]|nr:minor capsid protein [Oscillospiraceae bacterium]
MTDISIPKEALIHECILNIYRDEGMFEKETPRSTVILKNVRCSAEHTKRSDPKGDRIGKSGVLYFDCQNSSPEDVKFLEDGYRSEVIFGGETFAVTGVRYIYGTSGLHHLEVVLG